MTDVTDTVPSRLQNLLPDLLRRFPAIRVLYLFGSQAAGRERPGSDADVAVVLAPEGLGDPQTPLRIGAFLGLVQKPADPGHTWDAERYVAQALLPGADSLMRCTGRRGKMRR